jgi:hypothetical protein
MGLGGFWPCSQERTVDADVPSKPAKTGWLTPRASRVFLTSWGPNCGGGTTTTTWRTVYFLSSGERSRSVSRKSVSRSS